MKGTKIGTGLQSKLNHLYVHFIMVVTYDLFTIITYMSDQCSHLSKCEEIIYQSVILMNGTFFVYAICYTCEMQNSCRNISQTDSMVMQPK